jgi:D-threo-aldose 1-dehydrogenase
MDVTTPRKVGKSNLAVDPLGFGAAPISQPNITNQRALDTVTAAWDSGVRFFDTAPYYGIGRSERRLGLALSGVAGPDKAPSREEYRVNTKVGKTLVPEPVRDDSKEDHCPSGHVRSMRDPLSGYRLHFDYSGEAILQQHQDSLQRMGLASVDSLTIHDLDNGNHSAEQIAHCLHELADDGGRGGAVLAEMRDAGTISAIGCGVSMDDKTPANDWVGTAHADLCEQIADRVDLDFFIIAGPYTLLNTSAMRKFLPMCEERGISVITGAPYASGLLAAPDDPNITYMYNPPSKEILDRALRLKAISEEHGVPLAAAAIQFTLAHPTVAAVIPGARSPEEATQNSELVRTPVPDAVWETFKKEGLLDPEVPTPADV